MWDLKFSEAYRNYRMQVGAVLKTHFGLYHGTCMWIWWITRGSCKHDWFALEDGQAACTRHGLCNVLFIVPVVIVSCHIDSFPHTVHTNAQCQCQAHGVFCVPWTMWTYNGGLYVSVYYSGRSSDIWPTKTDPCPVKTKHDRSLCPVKISWKSVGVCIVHQHSDSVAMIDWEKDFSLWMHRTSLTSDGDKFNKRTGRWLVFWPTRNLLERSVVKLKFRSPVSTEQLLFRFTACARSLVTTRTRQPLFDLGPKLPTKDKEWHIIVLQHWWLGSANLQVIAIALTLANWICNDVVLMSRTCKYAQAWLCTLECQHCTQVHLPNQL